MLTAIECNRHCVPRAAGFEPATPRRRPCPLLRTSFLARRNLNALGISLSPEGTRRSGSNLVRTSNPESRTACEAMADTGAKKMEENDVFIGLGDSEMPIKICQTQTLPAALTVAEALTKLQSAIKDLKSSPPAFESGILRFQKLENPALRACLNVPSNEGVLVRAVEPTSPAKEVLKEGDVIVSFDGVPVANEATVPFRTSERIAFGFLITQKFTGDTAELGIIREGKKMNVMTTLKPRVQLVPYHIDEGQPSYLIVAGLVFTPLSEPLIDHECEEAMGLRLLAKARYSLPQFEGEQIVILSQILANELNIGYEEMSNQQVLKLNRFKIRNIRHLAHLVDSCKEKYLIFEFEDNLLVVLEREAASSATPQILKDYAIGCERSSDLTEPYLNSSENIHVENEALGTSPVLNSDLDFNGLLWA